MTQSTFVVLSFDSNNFTYPTKKIKSLRQFHFLDVSKGGALRLVIDLKHRLLLVSRISDKPAIRADEILERVELLIRLVFVHGLLHYLVECVSSFAKFGGLFVMFILHRLLGLSHGAVLAELEAFIILHFIVHN